MDDFNLAQSLFGGSATKDSTVSTSGASIVYMTAVTASSGGEVVLKPEVDDSWDDLEEGTDYITVDEDGYYDDEEDDDDSIEYDDGSVLDLTDGDGEDIEGIDNSDAYTVAAYHADAVAAYSEETEPDAEVDSQPEDETMDSTIDDGDAEDTDSTETADVDSMPGDSDTLTEDEADFTDDDDEDPCLQDDGDMVEDAEVSDGYTVASTIGSVNEGDRVAVMVQDGQLTVIGVVGSGDIQQAEIVNNQEAAEEAAADAAAAQEAADNAQQSANDAQTAADVAKNTADAAQTSANEAATAASNAQTSADNAAKEAQEANEKAQTAADSAAKANTDLAGVKEEVTGIKEDAVTLRSDLEGQIEAVTTTMQTDYASKDELSSTEASLKTEITNSAAGITQTVSETYAKKTDVTDAVTTAKAELQTQITQNADNITLTAKSVEQAQVDIKANATSITEAKNAAATAQSTANAAKTDAQEAATAAANAQSAADAANTAASNAQSKANEAATAASTAQAAADKAKTDLATAQAKLAEVESNANATAEDLETAKAAVTAAQNAADAAQSAADTAKANAAAAQSTADTAKANAATAQSTANTAKTNAANAQKAADDAQASADAANDAISLLDTRVTEAETKIEQNSEAITLRATKTEVTTAKNDAISAAATDATSKANAAKADAISAAATDATTKANNAKSDAISAAAEDATSKADAALSSAKSYADAQIKVSADSITSTVEKTYQTKEGMGDYSTTSQMNSAIEQKANEITSSVSATYQPKGDYPTKTEMNTAISQSASDITLSVSQTYATQTALNDAKTSAATDATNKANDALNNAKSYTDSVEVGGRNLIPNSASYSMHERLEGQETEIGYRCNQITQNVNGGETVTAQAMIRGRANVNFYFIMEGGNLNSRAIGKDEASQDEYKKCTVVFTVPEGRTLYGFYVVTAWGQTEVGDYFEIMEKSLKLEKGNKATDWTPAPEDQDAATQAVADDLANNYYTKTQTDAQIKVSSDSITSTVASTYQTKAGMGNYSTTEQMNSAITQKASEITSAVAARYQPKGDYQAAGDYPTVTEMNSAINQKADSITSTVAETYQPKGDYVTGTSAYSTLTQTVNGLSSTVQSHTGSISTLQQTAEGLQVRLENQQTVSNLVNKSRRLDGWGNVVSAGVTLSKNVSTSAPEFGEVTVAQFNASTSNTSAQSSYMQMTNAARVTSGKKYTFSMWARKVSGGNARPRFSMSSTNQSAIIAENLTTEWKRYSYTFTLGTISTSGKWSDITTSFGVSVLANQTGVFEICCPQLEAGDTMNPWSANSVDATDYMSFTQEGLVIGDMTEDGLGNNVLIDSDSLDLRNGTDVAASVSVEPMELTPYTSGRPITSQKAGFLSAKNIGIRADRYGSAALFIKETDIDEDTGEVSTVPRAHAVLYEELVDGVAQTAFDVYADYFNVMSPLWALGGIYTEGEVGAGRITLLGELDATSSSNEVASLTFKSGYQSYGTGYPNKVWRFGNVCYMQGAAKPTADKSASTSPVVFATIPERFRPKNTVYQICQGSGMNRWMLSVDSSGNVGWSRYGTTSSSAVSSGNWLVFSATWMIV